MVSGCISGCLIAYVIFGKGFNLFGQFCFPLFFLESPLFINILGHLSPIKLLTACQ